MEIRNVLILINIIQWIAIVWLVNHRGHDSAVSNVQESHPHIFQPEINQPLICPDMHKFVLKENVPPCPKSVPAVSYSKPCIVTSEPAVVASKTTTGLLNTPVLLQNLSEIRQYEGVAFTLLLHSPRWFQRRYTIMVKNVLLNLPKNWVLQIFYCGKGQSKAGIEINRGLSRLIEQGSVVTTVIPGELFKKKKKKIQLLTDSWIWNNVLAEQTMFFGGNSVICSNSIPLFQDFIKFDYIGTPWSDVKNGQGGDGGISIRSRSVMLAAIDYRERKATPHNGKEREDVFIVKTLIEMIKAGIHVDRKDGSGSRSIVLAKKSDTESFGGLSYFIQNFNSTVISKAIETIGPPLVASGTLPYLPFDIRDSFLSICPELKVIFPSMHDPACFGAHPNGAKCAQSICALRDPPRKGGC